MIPQLLGSQNEMATISAYSGVLPLTQGEGGVACRLRTPGGDRVTVSTAQEIGGIRDYGSTTLEY